MVATTIYLISPWVPLSTSGSSRVLFVAQKLPRYVGLVLFRHFAVFAVYCIGAAWFDVAGRCTGLRDHTLRTGQG